REPWNSQRYSARVAAPASCGMSVARLTVRPRGSREPTAPLGGSSNGALFFSGEWKETTKHDSSPGSRLARVRRSHARLLLVLREDHRRATPRRYHEQYGVHRVCCREGSLSSPRLARGIASVELRAACTATRRDQAPGSGER